MASIGEGAARGLESGFRMGQAFLDRRDQEEQRKRAQEMQDAQLAEQQAERAFQRSRLEAQDVRQSKMDARLFAADERQQNLDAEQALGQEFADLQAEGKGLLEQYGDFGSIPKDLGESYALRVKGTRARLQEARGKRYAPLIEQERQKASQLWAKIQAGQVPLEQVPDDQLVSSLTALTRRDITDFLPVAQGLSEGVDGGMSPVQQAGQDFMAGAQNGNDDQMIAAANVLFKPELMIGVGGPGRDGSEIVSKKIVQLVPHPNDPNLFTPLLEVKVRREDGKVGTYRAPVTENRSSDPDDNIKTISLQDGLERVGQLTTLAQALNQRGIIEKLAKGINDAGEGPKNFLEAYYATGGTKPQPKKVDIGHFEDFGGYKVHFLPDGRQVKIPKTATPTSGGGNTTETSARERQIERALKLGDITPEEAKQARRGLAMGVDKGKGAGAPTEDERKAAGWLSQARFAFDNMMDVIEKDPGAAEPNLLAEAAGKVPGVGGVLKNVMTPESRQQFEQASSSFAEAALRAATGAGVTRDEATQKIRELTPQIGDKPENIRQKRDALNVYLQSLESRAGRAAGESRPLKPRAEPGQPAQQAKQAQPITEGAIAVNPATGQRIQLKGGKWVPL